MRDTFGFHEIDPLGIVELWYIAQPDWFPLSARELAESTLPVGSLELESPGNYRVLISPTPRRVLTTVTALSYDHHMQRQRSIAHRHVPEAIPAVNLPADRVRVPCINCDPPVKRSRFVRKGEWLP